MTGQCGAMARLTVDVGLVVFDAGGVVAEGVREDELGADPAADFEVAVASGSGVCADGAHAVEVGGEG